MVDIKKIKGLMGSHDHSKKFIAKHLGISSTGIYNKLNKKTEFTASELKKISELYNLRIDELYE